MTASEFAAANAGANGHAAGDQPADSQANGHGLASTPAFGSGDGYDSAGRSADPGSAESVPAEPEPGFFDESAISEQVAAQEPAVAPF